MKVNYNETLIFYITTLKTQKVINSWKEGCEIYFNIEKKNISENTLSKYAKNINIENINLYQFFNYLENTNSYKKEEIKEENATKKSNTIITNDPMIRTLAIPKEDYKLVFDVDLDKDDFETIKHKVRTKIEDDKILLKYLGRNPSKYYVKDIIYGGWSTPVKLKDDLCYYVELIENDKFTVVLRKRDKEILFYTEEECQEFLDKYLKKNKITPFDFFEENINNNKIEYDDNLAMVCPGLELHLGKLGSVVDYEDYSTKQGMWRIKRVAKEILEYQEKNKAKNLILGVGNDYFNSDTVDDKTTAGTQQNNDTRFKEVYLWGKIGYLEFIETLKNHFDKVILKGHPGNHDEKSSYSLFTNLYDLYTMTNDKKIEVPFSYKDLRFTTSYVWGDNLIIFTHGKNPEGTSNLSDKKIVESIKYQFAEDYYKVKNVYVFAGHLHQDYEYKEDNVTIIRTASLTGIESWHSANLYFGQRQGHSVYLIDKKKGYLGKHNITIVEDDKIKKIKSIKRNPDTNVFNTMKKTLNLSNDSINVERQKERLKEIDKRINSYDSKYEKLIKQITSYLEVNVDITTDKLKELKEILGYGEEVNNLLEEKKYILKKDN